MGAFAALDLIKGFLEGFGFLIRSLVGHGIEGVHDGEDPCQRMDLFPFQALGITCPVILLMVLKHDGNNLLKSPNLAEDVRTVLGMLFQFFPLGIGEPLIGDEGFFGCVDFPKS